MHAIRQPRLMGTARTLLCASMLLAGTASAQTFNATGVGPIPDPGGTACGQTTGVPLNTSIAVSGVTGPLTAISVSITFNPVHTWGGDVVAELIAPGGSPTFVIFGRRGATTAAACGSGNDLAGPYVFVDPAVSTNSFWANASNPVAAGTYVTSTIGGSATGGTATNFLAAFSGLTTAQINGTWTLRFTDTGAADTGTVSAASLTLTGGPTDVPPQFAYAPAAGSTVTATGGGAVGSTGALTITPSIGTAGSGAGAAATTTTTCTAPTAPFTGFGQTVTAVGAGAIAGGPLSGSCTLGAAAVTQTLTCNENRGGTANARTWTLSCPAGSLTPLTSSPASGATVALGPQAVGSGAATGTVQFSNPNASAVSVTCTAPTATQFTVNPLTINVPANGSASTTISYSSATIGNFTGTLNCTAGAQTFTYNLSGSTVAAAVSVDAMNTLGKLLLLLGMMGIGLLAVRRH